MAAIALTDVGSGVRQGSLFLKRAGQVRDGVRDGEYPGAQTGMYTAAPLPIAKGPGFATEDDLHGRAVMILECDQQAVVRRWHLLNAMPGGLQATLRSIDVVLAAQQMPEPGQCDCGDPVA